MDIADVEVIAPNFKRRLSGVTSTIIQLVPEQARTLGIRALGPGLPDHLPKLSFTDLPRLWTRPRNHPFRIWHARRNIEMLPGIILRDILRMPLKLVFTSASQRRHTAYTRWLITRMDAVIATSDKTAAYLHVPSTTVLHGIDLARFAPPLDRATARESLGLDGETKLVGCFGRIRRQKGTDLFVEAMIALMPRHPGWTAIIAGRTTPEHRAFEADLRARISAAGLPTRIRFVGEHTDIERWYQALTLFIAPQRWEGFGLTPIEAMACGVPVVATDVGAFRELLRPGETGTLIAADDLPAMIAASDALMADDERRESMGEAALADMRARFALAREAAGIVAVYERLWSSARKSSSSKLTRR